MAGIEQVGGYSLPRATENTNVAGVCGDGSSTPVQVSGRFLKAIHCVCTESGHCPFEKQTVENAKSGNATSQT